MDFKKLYCRLEIDLNTSYDIRRLIMIIQKLTILLYLVIYTQRFSKIIFDLFVTLYNSYLATKMFYYVVYHKLFKITRLIICNIRNINKIVDNMNVYVYTEKLLRGFLLYGPCSDLQTG